MTKKESEILNAIKNYNLEFLQEDGFFENSFLYNNRIMYDAIKSIMQWKEKLNN